MFAFLFKDKQQEVEVDIDLEMAKLALSERIDALMAKEIQRKLRYSRLVETRH